MHFQQMDIADQEASYDFSRDLFYRESSDNQLFIERGINGQNKYPGK